MRAFIWIGSVAVILLTFFISSELGQLMIKRMKHYEPYPGGGHFVTRPLPGPKKEGEYYYGGANPKEYYALYITGTSCADLKGAHYGAWDGEGFIYGAAISPKEKAKREEWHNAERKYNLTYTCIPPVNNIRRYLDEGKADIHWRGSLLFENGPVLLAQKVDAVEAVPNIGGVPIPEKERDYREVTRVFKCSEFKNEFCVHIDHYVFHRYGDKEFHISDYSGTTGDFRVFCWDCKKFDGITPKAFEKMSKRSTDVLGNATLLEGAIMVNEEYLGKPAPSKYVQLSDAEMKRRSLAGAKRLAEIRKRIANANQH